MEDKIIAALAELENRDTSFHIKWSYLTKRYILTLPWLELEYEGKTLYECLEQALQDQHKE